MINSHDARLRHMHPYPYLPLPLVLHTNCNTSCNTQTETSYCTLNTMFLLSHAFKLPTHLGLGMAG